MVDQTVDSQIKLRLQKFVNLLLVAIGLGADLITLGLFYGIWHTPATNSNFYVNSREFLAWALIAVVYSMGFINAWIRRRWRRIYGTKRADHSVFNMFYWFTLQSMSSFDEDRQVYETKGRNFKRDFSILYVFMFLFTFLFGRAVTASENATGITPSPWWALVSTAFITVFVTLGMMVITSMFDFAMSIFLGDDDPQNL